MFVIYDIFCYILINPLVKFILQWERQIELNLAQEDVEKEGSVVINSLKREISIMKNHYHQRQPHHPPRDHQLLVTNHLLKFYLHLYVTLILKIFILIPQKLVTNKLMDIELLI